MAFMDKIKAKAKASLQPVVLPEGMDDRTLRAARQITDENIAKITLLGNPENIQKQAQNLGINLNDIEIIEPETAEKYDQYAEEYYQIRQHKGVTKEDALEIMKDPVFYGAMMVRNNEVKAGVSGAVNTTANVIRAGIHCVGVAEGSSLVSSFFIMIMPEFNGVKDVPFFFADSALVPNPTDEQLADIAITTADNWKALVGTEPQVAMLSFSTKGSANHEDVDKVVSATNMVKEKRPDLNIDGELQFDTAVMPSVGKRKAPDSPVAGKANVLIFPDLDAGNIGYKIAQRFGGADAIGPFVQGLNKSFNDLSRGCSAEDIVNTVAVAAVISQSKS